MRTIAAGLFISLDGVVESPGQWGFQFMNDEMSQGIAAGISQADTVLLGRRTYLEFAQLWPGQGSDVLMADFLNQSPKYVVSSTLEELSWQPAVLVKGDLIAELTRLKQQPGRNIQVPGSPSLVRYLLVKGLLDVLSTEYLSRRGGFWNASLRRHDRYAGSEARAFNCHEQWRHRSDVFSGCIR